MVITCTSPTTHYASGCELLRSYGNDDGTIELYGSEIALADYNLGRITFDEYNYVFYCYTNDNGIIGITCPGCVFSSVIITLTRTSVPKDHTESVVVSCRNPGNNEITCPTPVWYSTYPSVGYVSNNIFYAISEGYTGIACSLNGIPSNTVMMTVTPPTTCISNWLCEHDISNNNTGYKTDRCGNTEYDTALCPLDSVVASVIITPTKTSVPKNQTENIAMLCRDTNNNGIACPIPIWYSTNSSVGYVIGTTFYATSEGTTIIRCTSDGFPSNTITMTVTPITTICTPNWQCVTPKNGIIYDTNNCPGSVNRIDSSCVVGTGNGPCGLSTCYRCNGSSCIQDNVNGPFTTNACGSGCGTGTVGKVCKDRDPLKIGCIFGIPITYMVGLGAIAYMVIKK